MNRLRALPDCVGECRVLADIGTDHAYLPIEACRLGVAERAVACDICPGPLESARKNIKAAGLESRIETRLGDGLQPLADNEADCIVIAGMGGKRIMGILQDAPRFKKSKLILQPQHDLEELRRFLHLKKYKITEERLARERLRFYVILTAVFDGMGVAWTDKEYFLGKFGEETKAPDLQAYFNERHRKIAGFIESVSDKNMREKLEKQLDWLSY